MNGEIRLINQILFIILDGNKRWKKGGNYANTELAKVKVLRAQGIQEPWGWDMPKPGWVKRSSS